MDEIPAALPTPQRRYLKRIRMFVQRSVPFASGVLAALVALLLYNVLVPAPHQITKREVDTSVAQAMASATTPPSFSSGVYQIILPSLVLIQSQVPDTNGKGDSALGSGVVIDDQGDILTSLHVVADATNINLTFTDGTESSAEVVVKQPEHDIAVLRASQPPAKIVPAT